MLCVCADPERCHGCGAKHCGTHPIGEFRPPADEAGGERGDWWCSECKVALDGSRVTYDERCDSCGTPVTVGGVGLEQTVAALRSRVAAAEAERDEHRKWRKHFTAKSDRLEVERDAALAREEALRRRIGEIAAHYEKAADEPFREKRERQIIVGAAYTLRLALSPAETHGGSDHE